MARNQEPKVPTFDIPFPPTGIEVSELMGKLRGWPVGTMVTASKLVQEDLVFPERGMVVHRNERLITGPKGVSIPTVIEFDIVTLLAEWAGTVVDRPTIRHSVWGPHYFGDDHIVDVHISNAKRRLYKHSGIDSDVITTARGVGFMLNPVPKTTKA